MPKKYFAMIDGEQRGPYTLEQLPGSGVTPETYVWCKGMADWQQAADVADICRYYRNRLFDMAHPQSPSRDIEDVARDTISGDLAGGSQDQFMGWRTNFPMPEDDTDINERPQSMVPYAVFATFLCCPVTGLVAVYFAMMAQRYWREATRDEEKGGGIKNMLDEKDRRHLKRMAHDYTRQGKMWVGITFFMGFLMYAFVFQLI